MVSRSGQYPHLPSRCKLHRVENADALFRITSCPPVSPLLTLFTCASCFHIKPAGGGTSRATRSHLKGDECDLIHSALIQNSLSLFALTHLIQISFCGLKSNSLNSHPSHISCAVVYVMESRFPDFYIMTPTLSFPRRNCILVSYGSCYYANRSRNSRY